MRFCSLFHGAVRIGSDEPGGVHTLRHIIISTILSSLKTGPRHEAGHKYGGNKNLKRQRKLSSHKWLTTSFAFFCYTYLDYYL